MTPLEQYTTDAEARGATGILKDAEVKNSERFWKIERTEIKRCEKNRSEHHGKLLDTKIILSDT